MAREQLGISAEANLHATYLLLNVLEGHELVVRKKIARVPQLMDRLSALFSEALLTGVVGIGNNFWDSLYPDARPAELAVLPDFAAADISLVPQPVDLLLVIRSDRYDVNTIACQQLLQLLQSHTELQEQWHGFRYLDGRNLTGFVDAPFNPSSRTRRKVALVDAGQQPVFAAGSYVYLQQVGLDHAAWQQLTQAEQEDIMGYTKVTAIPLADGVRLSDSHLTVMQGSVETGPEVFMQNMPFYQARRQGLIQLSYAATQHALNMQLTRRLGLAEDSAGPDLLLDYCRIELTAAFFVPSISFLELASKG